MRGARHAAERRPIPCRVGTLRQRAFDAGYELGVGLFRTYVLKNEGASERSAAGRAGLVHHLRRRRGGRQVDTGRAASPSGCAGLGIERCRPASRAARRAPRLREVLLSGAAKPLGPAAEAMLFCRGARSTISTRLIRPALARGRVGALRPLRRFDARLSGRARRLDPRLMRGLERSPSATPARPDAILDVPAEIGLSARRRAARRRRRPTASRRRTWRSTRRCARPSSTSPRRNPSAASSSMRRARPTRSRRRSGRGRRRRPPPRRTAPIALPRRRRLSARRDEVDPKATARRGAASAQDDRPFRPRATPKRSSSKRIRGPPAAGLDHRRPAKASARRRSPGAWRASSSPTPIRPRPRCSRRAILSSAPIIRGAPARGAVARRSLLLRRDLEREGQEALHRNPRR